MPLTLGTNSGFVTVAPTTDPAATARAVDGSSYVTKHIAPANAVKISEIGWYRESGTNAANFEIALYSEAAGIADARLFVDATNSSTSTGWITTAVDWDITPSTAYWLGIQMDAHTGSSNLDVVASGGVGYDQLTTQTTLNDPYGGGAVGTAEGMISLYALVLPISAAITGTATASITEADIVTGGKTIIITLTNATFKAAGTGPIGSTADTQALIDNIDSAQAEATGWDAVVKVGIETTDVVRTSATVATITLDAEATYDITAQETITVTVPTAVLATGVVQTVATPTFTIAAAITGTATTTTDDANLSASGSLAIAAAAAITADDATLASVSALAIVGAVSITTDDATLAASGSSAISGSLAITLDDATAVSAGTLPVFGTSGGTAESAIMAATGALAIRSGVTVTTDDATLSSTGRVAIEADILLTTEDAVSNSSGRLLVSGLVTLTTDDAILVATQSTTSSLIPFYYYHLLGA